MTAKASQQATFPQCQRVHGAGTLRARRKLVGDPDGRFLVRHGDVEALASPGKKIPHHRREVGRRCVDGGVVQVLAGLCRKSRVDEWRAAVADGMADDGVLVRSVHAAAILTLPPHDPPLFSGGYWLAAAASWFARRVT